MSTIPWWVNAVSGMLCMALAVNFFAQAYGLRLGGKPLDTMTLPKYEPRAQDKMWPPLPLGMTKPDDVKP